VAGTNRLFRFQGQRRKARHVATATLTLRVAPGGSKQWVSRRHRRPMAATWAWPAHVLNHSARAARRPDGSEQAAPSRGSDLSATKHTRLAAGGAADAKR